MFFNLGALSFALVDLTVLNLIINVNKKMRCIEKKSGAARDARSSQTLGRRKSRASSHGEIPSQSGLAAHARRTVSRAGAEPPKVLGKKADRTDMSVVASWKGACLWMH